MIIRSNRLAIALPLATLLFTLSGCEKKEPRQPEANVNAAEQTQPYTTTQEVRVRSGPGTRYKIVAEIKSGTLVNVAGREKGWLKVVSKQGNPPGYIDERFAKPVAVPSRSSAPPAQGVYTTIADADVREGPGLHYKAVSKIEKGKEVDVVGGQGDWLKVQSRHGRPPGYIEKRYAERAPTNR
ncbi:MAG TPA: SH3 domain-containing protein [Candidatus Binatia bacterium]|jgi:N-acetylmuramoyl-L-alanine amidase